jgi:heme oxygenase (biliverdin-IX-beta and delta-forming)
MTATLRRFQLRERTAAAHAVVDSAIGGFDTVHSYRRYLASLYRFRAPLEARLAADWSAVLGPWRPASIAAAIRTDMFDLGVSVPALPALDLSIDTQSLLGTLYVLEGSSLGARVLFKRAEALGLTAEHGALHLAQQCERLDDWRAFLDILETTSSFDIEQATTASLAAYAVAARAFEAH